MWRADTFMLRGSERNVNGVISQHRTLISFSQRRSNSIRLVLVQFDRDPSEFPGNLRHESSRPFPPRPAVQTRKTEFIVQDLDLVFAVRVTASASGTSVRTVGGGGACWPWQRACGPWQRGHGGYMAIWFSHEVWWVNFFKTLSLTQSWSKHKHTSYNFK